ncbi:16853_t:CDS:2 [Acaulospora morrowiae]|uniref:16853_t:CDS:1 n=1 Tax=Acaulospora morrowiae TaxID=94023 RepID=A0A9N9FT85_9GLOM|nr:16853_t:CDS:2 [Acaulospora morrowiae]
MSKMFESKSKTPTINIFCFIEINEEANKEARSECDLEGETDNHGNDNRQEGSILNACTSFEGPSNPILDPTITWKEIEACNII